MSISSLRGIVSRVMPTRKPHATPITAARVDYAKIAATAEEKAAAFQHPKGKNTARERLNMLLDADSFVEIGQFAGGNPATGFLGAAVVTGFGEIAGRQVAVYAQDFSVRGGTLGRAEGQKILALMDKALAMKIPIISMLDSGGARIQEGVIALSQYGRIFKKTCEASGLIPQISMMGVSVLPRLSTPSRSHPHHGLCHFWPIRMLPMRLTAHQGTVDCRAWASPDPTTE